MVDGWGVSVGWMDTKGFHSYCGGVLTGQSLFYNQDFCMCRRSWSDLSGKGAGNITVQTSTGVGRVFATSDPAILSYVVDTCHP